MSGVTSSPTSLLSAEAKIKDIAALPPPQNISGKAVDGYIAFGYVFADANGNGVQDPGEASAHHRCRRRLQPDRRLGHASS